MTSRSSLTYAGALAILGQHEHPLIERLNEVAGAGLLVTATVFPPALALFDAKNEAVGLFKKLLDRLPNKLYAMTGRDRQDLIRAAHTVVAIYSILDSLQDVFGEYYKTIAPSDQEFFSANQQKQSSDGMIEQLLEMDIPLPSPDYGFAENIHDRIRPQVEEIAGNLLRFCSGLEAWGRLKVNRTAVKGRIVSLAMRKYESTFWALAARVPDLWIWSSLTEHYATRRQFDQRFSHLEQILSRQSDSLARTHDLLSIVSPAGRPGRTSNRGLLARAASAVLNERLLRTESPPTGIEFPTIANGFVTPHFRLSTAVNGKPISQREWWINFPIRQDLNDYLVSYLSHPDACLLPLVILGHPGAGKSLFTEVLAARLPSQGFTVVHVPLRHVHADDKLLDQIEHTLRMKLKKDVSWGTLADECQSTIRVVILDGLDELIQATGVTQSGYLTEVRRFQQEEYDLGRAVAFIVTSRTVVLDRARVPDGCPLLRLENFDKSQLATWIRSWNKANQQTPAFIPLELNQMLAYEELARQPLLLTMIAVFAANSEGNHKDFSGLSSSELYGRLVDESIRRQVLDKPTSPPDDNTLSRLLAERRRLLSIAALAMFNRGKQDVSEHELNRDFDALEGPADVPQIRGPGSAITRAHRIIADFFFVHVAGVDLGSTSEGIAIDAAKRNYEFLHSTFGEYLIAERVLKVLSGLARKQVIDEDDQPIRSSLNDIQIRSILSHKPLLNRPEILDFLVEIFAKDYSRIRRDVLHILAELIRLARASSATEMSGYDPSPRDIVSRVAAYTVNLVTILLGLDGGAVPLERLAPDGADPMEWWRSTVLLWHAGLEPEGWAGVFATITAVGPMGDGDRPQIRALRSGDRSPVADDRAQRELLFNA